MDKIKINEYVLYLIAMRYGIVFNSFKKAHYDTLILSPYAYTLLPSKYKICKKTYPKCEPETTRKSYSKLEPETTIHPIHINKIPKEKLYCRHSENDAFTAIQLSTTGTID